MTTTINTAVPSYVADGVLTDGEAWVPLSTTVFTGDANNVTLESSTGANDWSQYMDLILIINARNDYGDVGNSASYLIYAHLNDDATSSNYKFERFYAVGASTGIAQFLTGASGFIVGQSVAINDVDVFGGSTCTLSDINSGKFKVGRMNAANATDDATYQNVTMSGSFWSGTEAITKIKIYADTGGTYNFVADTRIDLFGVLPRMVNAW
tara:strand:- start:1063 stop:1692 length:630 start_codon:yes stop_codon:yes gene_type:complete